ncbi:MAG TPA: M48 family metalloprotease [Candidatus Angelobacter sp.]|nr:M48 family metalloprotease [Candidatus Angelobacter sp.]
MRWLSFAAVFALLAAGLVLSQARKAEAPVGPNALLYLVADTQRELTRLPMKYTEIPDKQEAEIGDRIAKNIVENEQSDEAKGIEAYLNSVGKRLAANAHRKLPYKFHYIDEPYFVNAFAIPGGHVFMGAGLMALMENEDELAAVLGHEIEHIDHRHCAERLQTEAALKKIPFGDLVAIPVTVFQEGYSKDQESEADIEGTRLSVISKYSPQGAVQIFTEFQKMEEEFEGKRKPGPEEEVARVPVQILTGYFRSHPPSGDRVAQIRDLIAQEKWTVGAQKPLAVRYIYLAHKALELVKAKKYDEAIAAADLSLQLHPGHPPALVALAKASCAKQDFARAKTAYLELLANHQAEADAIRVFADESAAAALHDKWFEQAGKFASFSLELQPNNPNALKLLAEVKLEARDVEAALEIGRKMQTLYPGAARDLVLFADEAARDAFAAHNYARAALFAGFSTRLSTIPDREVMAELARSQFALADFAGAAATYNALIARNIRLELALDQPLISEYADALGAEGRRADAARDFQSTVKPTKNVTDDLAAGIRIEEAGLMVLAGNESLARPLAEGRETFAPERASRLGWWYYRAGKYDDAGKVLRRFLSQRPGDAGLQTTLGWVQLEQNSPGEAIHRFEIYFSDSTAGAPAHAGHAAARWRLGQTDAAIAEFDALSKDAPEWTNPAWVRALYGPVAAQTMQELYAEQQRRIEARKVHVVRKR